MTGGPGAGAAFQFDQRLTQSPVALHAPQGRGFGSAGLGSNDLDEVSFLLRAPAGEFGNQIQHEGVALEALALPFFPSGGTHTQLSGDAARRSAADSFRIPAELAGHSPVDGQAEL